MNENPHPMVNRSFAIWQPPPPPPPAAVSDEQINNPLYLNPARQQQPPFFPPPSSSSSSSSSSASDLAWMTAHHNGRIPRNRRKNAPAPAAPPAASASRRFASKRNRFSRFAPFAPRNTTSFIIRAKKAGGIASQSSPYPVTPAILPTPRFSPSREGLVDMAKEEWGVDGYGSMKGLIRLRSPVVVPDGGDDDDADADEGGSSEGSDVEEHVEVERRLDQDLSRFEMVYNPGGFGLGNGDPFLVEEENWVGDRGDSSRMTELEGENLTLRERLFSMEREMEEMKSRLMLLETRFGVNREEVEVANEEVLDNEGAGDLCSEEH